LNSLLLKLKQLQLRNVFFFVSLETSEEDGGCPLVRKTGSSDFSLNL
jgi:hypothetical protein